MAPLDIYKEIKIWKGLFPTKWPLSNFIAGHIEVFGWKRFFEGSLSVRLDRVKFFRGFIHPKKPK